eukprot:TRINITY_DN95859_c0_g1_i1.p1 TRINITY_DN95859_c0_g1~~TRINITY_DN95859_c0_g1_i1.p1  ORF type:complete len:704 (-),score=115.29 TRINITY_DN95859_c0_g1_i1:119-2230(-)
MGNDASADSARAGGPVTHHSWEVEPSSRPADFSGLLEVECMGRLVKRWRMRWVELHGNVVQLHKYSPCEAQPVLASDRKQWDAASKRQVPRSAVRSPALEGWGWKTGAGQHSMFQKRYFVLAYPMLYYFKSDKADEMCSGAMYLRGATWRLEDELGRASVRFEQAVPRRPGSDETEFHLAFPDHVSRQKWVSAIRDAADSAEANRGANSPSSTGPGVAATVKIDLDITGCTIEDLPGKPFAWTLRGGNLTDVYSMAANSESEKDIWWKHLFRASTASSPDRTVGSQTEFEEDERASLSEYEFLKVIGKGAFGKVLKVRNRTTGEVYALKSMKKQKVLSMKMLKCVTEESTLIRSLEHPFIVKLHATFQTPERLFLVFDYLSGGNLVPHIRKELGCTEEVVRLYSAQLTLALEYLHERGIVHRDLKPDNAVLDGEGNLVLTDFGMATRVESDGKCKGVCGSLAYMAPELLEGKRYTTAVDMWAAGISLYYMFFVSFPYKADKRKELAEEIKAHPVRFPREAGNGLSQAAQDLILRMLDKDAKTRITAKEMRTHAFFASTDWQAVLRKEMRMPFRGPAPVTRRSEPRTDMSYVQAPCTDLEFEGFQRDARAFDKVDAILSIRMLREGQKPPTEPEEAAAAGDEEDRSEQAARYFPIRGVLTYKSIADGYSGALQCAMEVVDAKGIVLLGEVPVYSHTAYVRPASL